MESEGETSIKEKDNVFKSKEIHLSKNHEWDLQYPFHIQGKSNPIQWVRPLHNK